jgi:hypothetical protein
VKGGEFFDSFGPDGFDLPQVRLYEPNQGEGPALNLNFCPFPKR